MEELEIVKLYNDKGENTISVLISKEDKAKWDSGEKWDTNWIRVMMDVKAIERAEF
jgi:hypothetical protein